MKRIALAAVILLWATSAFAQINVPDTIPVYKPIVADCVVPASGSVRIIWTVDPAAEFVEVGNTIHVWAAPGEHSIEAIVVVQSFVETTVFVPDPEFPTDVSKAKLEKIKVAGPVDVQRYTKKYKVVGAGPPPVDPVDPDKPPPPGPGTPTSVTYVYEKDQGGIPPPVSAALSKLNAGGIRATTFEEDTVDGSGDVPEQYRIPLEAARKAGLPALVIMAGANVKRVVKAPTTEAQVMEAAQSPAVDGAVIPPLRSVLAALNCGCQSGKRCTCHANGGHCNCKANMVMAKRLYPEKIVRPKAKPAKKTVTR